MGDRRRRPRVSVVILSLVAVGLAGWGVMRSPVFEIREVRVQGNLRLTADHVRDLSGVRLGGNVFRANLDRAEIAVEGDPWVSEATASRALPSVVEIEVTERRAAGWVRGQEGWVAIAGDGMVLEMLEGRPRDLPRLSGIEGDLEPGRAFADTPAHVRAAGSLGPMLRRRVRDAALEGTGNVVLNLRTGERVIYGPAEDLAAKNAALEAMLEWADRRGMEVLYLDVRSPQAPALRPAGSDEDVTTPTGG